MDSESLPTGMAKGTRLTPPVSPSTSILAFNAVQPSPNPLYAHPVNMKFRERWRFWHQRQPTTATTNSASHQKPQRFQWRLVIVVLPITFILIVTIVMIASQGSIAGSLSSSRKGILEDTVIVHHGDWRHRRDSIRIDEAKVYKRQDSPVLSLGDLNSSPTTTPTPTSSLPNTEEGSNGFTEATSTTSILTVAPSVPSDPAVPTPFVQPFDETLSSDFLTGTCQLFFANLTTALEFRQCRPFSLLLSSSQAFLSAQSNLTLLTNLIYGTCNTKPTEEDCIMRMNNYQTDIRQQCSQELDNGHALAWDALNGFKNYELYRKAGCLQNMRTNSYCFADAVAASPPSDIYFYQLPLGTALPGSSTSSSSSASETAGPRGLSVTPTCSPCTQSLMSIFASYATNSSLLISDMYPLAQQLTDQACGIGYAPAINAALGPRIASLAGWSMIVSVVILAWALMGL